MRGVNFALSWKGKKYHFRTGEGENMVSGLIFKHLVNVSSDTIYQTHLQILYCAVSFRDVSKILNSLLVLTRTLKNKKTGFISH
jgi:hypothetical protein